MDRYLSIWTSFSVSISICNLYVYYLCLYLSGGLSFVFIYLHVSLFSVPIFLRIYIWKSILYICLSIYMLSICIFVTQYCTTLHYTHLSLCLLKHSKWRGKNSSVYKTRPFEIQLFITYKANFKQTVVFNIYFSPPI